MACRIEMIWQIHFWASALDERKKKRCLAPTSGIRNGWAGTFYSIESGGDMPMKSGCRSGWHRAIREPIVQTNNTKSRAVTQTA